MTTGERIKQRRLELKMTVDELAKKLNKNRATIYRYESDEIENLPTSILVPLAKALETTPAYLMGWEDYEDPHIVERDAILEDIERILKTNGWSLSCESYDNDYFMIKNRNGQTITGLYDYELISRYQSLKKKGTITADLLVSSEFAFKKYVESLGYYIDRDEMKHKPFIHYGNGAIMLSDDTLNDIRSKIDTYAKATIDSVILKLNENELRKKRKEKERITAYLLNAAHDEGATEEQKAHADKIMDDDSEWE